MKEVLLDRISVYQKAISVADDIWEDVLKWGKFPKDNIGGQIVRAVDSVAANIAEGYGRYNYGEKIRFYYFSRGSLYESQFWIKRAYVRKLIQKEKVIEYLLIFQVINKELNKLIKACKDKKNKA